MKKENKISFRVHDEDYDLIRQKADAMGMNISEFSRFCVTSVIKENYVPKTKVLYFIHQIMTDSDLRKNKVLCKKFQEMMKKCL